jgi:twitching motility protein PilT
MQVGQAKFGMQTMNQSLAALYAKGLITLDVAMGRSPDQEELRQMLSRGGAGGVQERPPQTQMRPSPQKM